MERTAMPANELEGLIRGRLPDAVRRHLRDVQIDQIDRAGLQGSFIVQKLRRFDGLRLVEFGASRVARGL